MPRGDEIGPEFQGLVQKGVEFYLAVAQHVGIGRTSAFVFGEHVVHHAPTILGREVDEPERNVETLGHQLGEDLIVVPRAVAFERALGIVPVAHEQPDDLVPLLFEEICRHRRIDTARQSDHYFCHSENFYEK